MFRLFLTSFCLFIFSPCICPASLTKDQIKCMVEEINADIELIAKVIFGECSICSTHEQYLIGSVILNRRFKSSSNTTVFDIVHQKGQFQGKKNFYRAKELNSAIMAYTNSKPSIYYFYRPQDSSGIDTKGLYHLFSEKFLINQ